jgi:DNA-binding CsgD family transcriptional regulator
MTRDERQSLPDLLESLYRGLLMERSWDPFLRALAFYLDGSFATLILTAPGHSMIGEVSTPGAGTQAVETYAATLFATDPFVGLSEGKVVAFADFMAGRELSEEWQHFLERSGENQILGVDIRLESGLEARFRVTRNRSQADFTPRDREAFQALVQHLRTGALLHERLQTSAIEHGVYRAVMEQMAVATIIVDHKGRILESNAVADRLLAAADGIARRGDRLVLNSSAARMEVERLLRNPPPSGATARVRIERPSGARDLSMSIRPAGAPSYMGEGGPALALFIGDPVQGAHASPGALRDIFQLTRMEATIAAALADGVALVDVAARLGISHNTARSHLRAAFAKTGAHRQSQLVHLIQSSLAQLSSRDVNS